MTTDCRALLRVSVSFALYLSCFTDKHTEQMIEYLFKFRIAAPAGQDPVQSFTLCLRLNATLFPVRLLTSWFLWIWNWLITIVVFQLAYHGIDEGFGWLGWMRLLSFLGSMLPFLFPVVAKFYLRLLGNFFPFPDGYPIMCSAYCTLCFVFFLCLSVSWVLGCLWWCGTCLRTWSWIFTKRGLQMLPSSFV